MTEVIKLIFKDQENKEIEITLSSWLDKPSFVYKREGNTTGYGNTSLVALIDEIKDKFEEPKLVGLRIELNEIIQI